MELFVSRLSRMTCDRSTDFAEASLNRTDNADEMHLLLNTYLNKLSGVVLLPASPTRRTSLYRPDLPIALIFFE